MAGPMLGLPGQMVGILTLRPPCAARAPCPGELVTLSGAGRPIAMKRSSTDFAAALMEDRI